MDKSKIIYIALISLGIVVAITNNTLTFIYGVTGLLCLTYVQLSMLPKSGKWIVIGGNPTAKIESKLKVVSLSGASMIFGAFSGFLIKLAWLNYAL